MFKRVQRLGGEAGFTLVELLVTTTIIGVLSAVVTVGVSGASTTAQTKSNQALFNSVQAGLDSFSAQNPSATGAPTSGNAVVDAAYFAANGNGGIAASTTSTTTVAPGSVVVTPASMTGIAVGTNLLVDTSTAQETVTVTAVTSTTFTATFTKAHGPSSWAIGPFVTTSDFLIDFTSSSLSFSSNFRLNNSSGTFKCVVATATTFTLKACRN